MLAAGYATRLYPLTRDRPKALLEIGGVPMLTRILARLARLPALREIVVVSNARFAEAFRRWAGNCGSPCPLRILDDGTREEASRLGAVGDLAFALREAPPDGEDLLVAAGDNLIEFDLQPAARDFAGRRAPLLLVRELASPTDARSYNEVVLAADGRVASFREKPDDARSGLAAIALYFLTPAAAALVPRYLEEGGNPDAPGHFVAWLVQKTPVFAHRIAGGWHDVGNVESLERARRAFAGAAPAPSERRS